MCQRHSRLYNYDKRSEQGSFLGTGRDRRNDLAVNILIHFHVQEKISHIHGQSSVSGDIDDDILIIADADVLKGQLIGSAAFVGKTS